MGLRRTLVSELPGDVLCDLYQALSAIDRPTPDDLGWTRMTMVNRAWRSIGLELPILWARDYGSMASHDAVDAFRMRARDIPLTVCITQRLSKQHENVLIYAVSANIRRIETLSLKAYSYLWSSLVAGKRLPELRILHLDDSRLHMGSGSAPSDYLEMDFPLHAPRLTHVSLRGCRLFPLVAPSLKSLTLADQRTTSARVLDVLRGVPSLEHLVLDMSVFNIYARDQVAHREPVQLPRLRTFRILPASEPSARGTRPVISHQLKNALIRRIITPNDTERDIVIDDLADVAPNPQAQGPQTQQVAVPVLGPAVPQLNPAPVSAQPLVAEPEPPSYEFVMAETAPPAAAVALAGIAEPNQPAQAGPPTEPPTSNLPL